MRYCHAVVGGIEVWSKTTIVSVLYGAFVVCGDMEANHGIVLDCSYFRVRAIYK